MIRGKLIKLESTHSNLRTTEVEGIAPQIPQVGESFMLVGKALDPSAGNARLIHTTPVKEIIDEMAESFIFKTENSTYRFELMKEEPPEQSPAV
jgi:hypothetical protein